MSANQRTAPRAALGLAAAVVAWVGASACGKGDEPSPDAGVGDLDAAVPDSGVRALCPVDPTPACRKSTDCADASTPPTNCAACPGYNRSLCATAQCTTPPQLESGDIHKLKMPRAAGLGAVPLSFAGIVVAAETSGGASLSCSQVYAGVDLTDACYNVLDSRGYSNGAGAVDFYEFIFTRFASGQRVLFVVYAFDQDETQGRRIGVSCTEYQVQSPGLGLQIVEGDTMRPIL